MCLTTESMKSCISLQSRKTRNTIDKLRNYGFHAFWWWENQAMCGLLIAYVVQW